MTDLSDVIVNRFRPRRLRGGHQGGGAGLENRVRGKRQNARRHLPECRLHPFQGIARYFREIRPGGASFRGAGDQGRQLSIDLKGDHEAQGRSRRRPDQRHRRPV